MLLGSRYQNAFRKYLRITIIKNTICFFAQGLKMLLKHVLLGSTMTLAAAITTSQAFAQNTSIPQTRSAENALAEIAEVRMLARAASLCKWSSSDEAMSIATHFAPTIIGIGTESFEACQKFVEGNGKLASDEMMGEAPSIPKSICNDASQKAKWNQFKQTYDYDKAEAATGKASYSDDVCAYQPLKANRLTAAEAQGYLISGANKCNVQVVEKAITLGADPNQPVKDQFALAVALDRNENREDKICVETVKMLLKKGAKANQLFGDRSALHIAIQAPSELIDTLINAGADPKATIPGETPKITLADYNAVDPISVGQTPLMYFVKYRTSQIERPLGKNDPGAEDSMRVLNMYLKKSDINARDWLGRTALIFAVEKGSNKVARALLAAGADKTIKDQFGRNALAYAKLAKNKEMEKLLSK